MISKRLRILAGNIYILIDDNYCDAERIRIRIEAEIYVLSRVRFLDRNLEPEMNGYSRHFFPKFNHKTNQLKAAKCWSNQSVPTSWLSDASTWERVIREMADQVKLMLEIDMYELNFKTLEINKSQKT